MLLGDTSEVDSAGRPKRNPRGSKYPIFKTSGSKNHTFSGFSGLEILNIGYLDPLELVLEVRHHITSCFHGLASLFWLGFEV